MIDYTEKDWIDRWLIKRLYKHINDLVAECIDENGQPKAPSKKAIIKARGALTNDYPMTLIKDKECHSPLTV